MRACTVWSAVRITLPLPSSSLVTHSSVGVSRNRGGRLPSGMFFATLLRAKTSEGALILLVSEPYHDEQVAAVQNLRPWIVAAVILLIVAYTAPFLELANARYEGAPRYIPGSPVPQ